MLRRLRFAAADLVSEMMCPTLHQPIVANKKMKPVTSGKILVVDDTPVNVTLLADLLTHHGYAVTTAASGEDALDQMRQWMPDMVLLDVMMPGLSGFETCARIRALEGGALLPVVMVTSLDSKEDRVRGIEAGADDFLNKPINSHELLARVRSLMRIRTLHTQVAAQSDALREWALTLESRVAEEVAKGERLARLKRFFSPHLVEMIVAGGADDPLVSHRREISVVFLDLRGFTAFAETGEPEVVMGALADFHRVMGELVLEHKGTLERFTGDGMMIFFNDPVPTADHTLRAAEMAVAMRDAAARLHATWTRSGFDLALGIGIARGYATVGAIGFDGRIDYAAIGSVTNMAARLCDRAEAGEILMTQRAYAEIEAQFAADAAVSVNISGLARPIEVRRLTGRRGQP